MHADGFEDILKEFSQALECVKPLCQGIRRVLFPFIDDGKLDTGTPPDPEKLYAAVIEAFNDAIYNIASIESQTRKGDCTVINRAE